MPANFPQSQRKTYGFSLLELTIVIIIISALLAIAIDRLLKLQVQAERAAMEGVIGNLQSAIALTISEHIAKDRIRELRKYVYSNPMDMLANAPVNYLGTFPDRPEQPESASWWYDQKSRSLTYLVMNKDYFFAQNSDPGHIKFKILPVYDDKNSNKRFDRHDALKGLRLKAVSTYQWLNEPIDAEQMVNRLKQAASSN